MKFGEALSSALTPEWRKQYIRYEELKSMIYNIMLEAPTDPEAREEYVAQMDETFFAECERELVKINLFFSQKIAEAQGKYHELSAELNTFKEAVSISDSRQAASPPLLCSGVPLDFALATTNLLVNSKRSSPRQPNS
uniref:SPX domain-containing protein n=1 Tax=Ditylenchus dipsaci TaxID=166011 RepID=A0A915DL61_9BILA